MTARVASVSALTGEGHFAVQQYPVPAPEPGAVLVRMELAGICATDGHVLQGHWPNLKYPVVLGHENAGVVEALGAGVERDFLGSDLAVGDRVVFKAGDCGRCAGCVLEGGGRRCENRMAGYGFAGPATDPPHFTGGFGQFVYVRPGTIIFKTPLDAATAVLTEPMAVAVSAVARSGIQLGDTVVVQGSGAIGLLTLACARLAGAMRTIVIGAPRGRLELARELGADETVDITAVPSAEERIRLARDLTPRRLGADIVFGCVGRAAAMTEGLVFVKPGTGRMVELGNALGTEEAVIQPAAQLVNPSITLIGHWATRTPHWVRALAVLEKGRLPFDRLVSHKVPLHDVEPAVRSLLGDYMLYGREAIKIAVAPNGA